jgi:hypothetical protein
MLRISSYTVRSQVSLSDFRIFVSALEGASVSITKDNLGGLSRLCEEFNFVKLGRRLSHFRESDGFTKDVMLKDLEARKRLSASEERMQRRACESDDFKADGTTEGENNQILLQFPKIKQPGALFDDVFKFTAEGSMFECNVAQAIARSSAVSGQLSVDVRALSP